MYYGIQTLHQRTYEALRLIYSMACKSTIHPTNYLVEDMDEDDSTVVPDLISIPKTTRLPIASNDVYDGNVGLVANNTFKTMG